MKRIIPSALLVFCLLFLPTNERSLAGEEATIKLASLEWHLLKPGVTKTDLGKKLPEVAILKLSNEQFEKIHVSKKAALEYLNDQHIFKRKLIAVIFCNVGANKSDSDWVLIIPHTPYSTACIVAYQVSKETKIE